MKKGPEEIEVTICFVDEDNNVVYDNVEQAVSEMSKEDQVELKARIMTAVTGKTYRPV
ncbi:MAG: hypothetical protein K6T85_06615 [Gorillibacterium sp.]|nr:hypothetical protein [Gorillibacterium sp.]